MALTFQSLRSSSSGNCLMIQSESTTLLLDCGIKTQSECRDLLDRHARKLDAVIVSHAHGDHICYSSLRTLERLGTPIHCHEQIVRQVHDKHVANRLAPPCFQPFSSTPFAIGDFTILPIPLPHAPDYPNFGFIIECTVARTRKKIVVCTDFNDCGNLLAHLDNTDFLFIEANHDLDLLRKFWNPSSRYHLSNPKTAQLLCHARKTGRFTPRTIMLGHLSSQRNTAELALDTIRQQFQADEIDLDFHLEVAPRREPSRTIRIE